MRIKRKPISAFELKENCSGIISEINLDIEQKKRLNDLGIIKNFKIEMVRKYKTQAIIKCIGSVCGLGIEFLDNIMVLPCKDEYNI